MAGLVLGLELSEAARPEAEVRSRRASLRPPWRRERGVERRRVHAPRPALRPRGSCGRTGRSGVGRASSREATPLLARALRFRHAGEAEAVAEALVVAPIDR